MVIGTQKELARLARVSASYVNQIVKFRVAITKWSTAKKFAQLTGTDPADWLEMRRDVLSEALEKLTPAEVRENAKEEEYQACRIAS
jgi:plasmid maintenance system antidote protein VapI